MPQNSAHVPETGRNLPADFYRQFDIHGTPDGGRRYTLPHTLGATIIARSTTPRIVSAVAAFGVTCALIFPERDPGSPLSSFCFHATLDVLLLHAVVALAIGVAALVTGTRKVTHITIRSDGMILNDTTFYASEHIWSIGYGTTFNAGQPDETFEPKLTIQIGTQTITLADGLQPDSAKLFMQLFQDDTRRYWHRHN